MMIKSMEKQDLIRNDYMYFCYNLSILNLVYVVLEEGSGEIVYA